MTSQHLSPGVPILPEEQPEIAAGSHLILRPWRPADAPQIVKAFEDPAIRSWHRRVLDTEPKANRWMAEWHERWEASDGAGWAIALKSDPEEVVGAVAFRALYLGDGLAECSYWVVPDHRGEGVAPQATRALCDWAFEELKLHRLELLHSVRNRPSCRVALKAGFELEGIERSLQRYGRRVHDMHLHARVQPAQTRAKPWDRAHLDVGSHGTLWVIASLLGVASAYLSVYLATDHRIAIALPLVVVGAMPMFEMMVVDRPRRKHERQQRDNAELQGTSWLLQELGDAHLDPQPSLPAHPWYESPLDGASGATPVT